MTPGLVSVILPVYNGERYVRKAVESVLKQTYSHLEIVAIDDGSTDSSAAVLDSYRDRMRVVRQTNCGNVGQVRNIGMERAEGEFIAFLDQDDWWQPAKLERQVVLLRRDEQMGLVHTGVIHFDDAENHTGPLNPLSEPHRMTGRCLEVLLLGNSIYNSSVMVRRSALDETGLCDQGISGNTVQDYDLWLRIAERFCFGFIEECLTCYRVHGEQGMWDRRGMLEAELALLLRIRDDSFWLSDPRRRRRLANLYDELAVAYLDQGDLRRARHNFRLALAVRPCFRHGSRFAGSLLPQRIVDAIRK